MVSYKWIAGLHAVSSQLSVAPASETSSTSTSDRVAWLTYDDLNLLEIPFHLPPPHEFSHQTERKHAANTSCIRMMQIPVASIQDAARCCDTDAPLCSAPCPEHVSAHIATTRSTCCDLQPDEAAVSETCRYERCGRGRTACEISRSQRCVNIVMSDWHVFVLVVTAYSPCQGSVVIVSHITGAIVQVCRRKCMPSILKSLSSIPQNQFPFQTGT